MKKLYVALVATGVTLVSLGGGVPVGAWSWVRAWF
jgi:hypothetical protein